MWRYGCPKKKVLFGAGAVALTGQEVRVRLLLKDYEHNVDNLALEAVGQDWSDEVRGRSVSSRLGCHMEIDLFSCQETRDACWVSSKSRSSPLFAVYGPAGNIHARSDAMSGFLFVLTWVGDCKTYFEGCYGAVCRNPCTEKSDVGFLFVFIWVVDRKTNFETSCAAVLMP